MRLAALQAQQLGVGAPLRMDAVARVRRVEGEGETVRPHGRHGGRRRAAQLHEQRMIDVELLAARLRGVGLAQIDVVLEGMEGPVGIQRRIEAGLAVERDEAVLHRVLGRPRRDGRHVLHQPAHDILVVHQRAAVGELGRQVLQFPHHRTGLVARLHQEVWIGDGIDAAPLRFARDGRGQQPADFPFRLGFANGFESLGRHGDVAEAVVAQLAAQIPALVLALCRQHVIGPQRGGVHAVVDVHQQVESFDERLAVV